MRSMRTFSPRPQLQLSTDSTPAIDGLLGDLVFEHGAAYPGLRVGQGQVARSCEITGGICVEQGQNSRAEFVQEV